MTATWALAALWLGLALAATLLSGPVRLDALRRLNQQHPDDVVRLAAAQALTRYV